MDYEIMTQDKLWTLDCEITIKELLDVWWNSVRLRFNDGKMALLYKCCDNSYELDDDESNPLGEKVLDLKVRTSDYWDYDGDGYPIIYAYEL